MVISHCLPLNVINQRVSLLIMSHLREALQSILFSCCLRRLPARKSKQHVLKHCSENRPCVHPPPFCPQLTLCLLISSSGALLEGPSPPSFWRHKELEIKIFLFCAPSYEKWEPFWFTEWHSGLGRANTQDPNSPVCVGWSAKWSLLHWSPGGNEHSVHPPFVGPKAFKRKKVPS